jgi:ABC-2 type transport system permease protein
VNAAGVEPIQHHDSAWPEFAIARMAFAQVRIGAALVALGFGGSALATARAYASTYPTAAEREQAAALISDQPGFAVLLGPVNDIGTVGGYMVYKNFVFLTSIGAVWALLLGTRLLRGEEDTGRWQLMLTGSTRPARATVVILAALGLAVAAVFAGTTALTLLAGRDHDLDLGIPDTFLYGASLALVPAVFATVGAFTSQLCRTRRAATTLAMTGFGLALGLRMIADAGPQTHWLLWVTPLGWAELMRPFTENNAWPLLPAALAVLSLGAASAMLAARRDVGGGVFLGHDARRPRSAGLTSAGAFSVRLELPVLLAWCLGAAVTGLVLGTFAKIATTGSVDTLRDNLDRYGVQGTFLSQLLGIEFLLVATVVALLPAGQLSAAEAEETSGRLVHLLARPVRRATWLLGRLVLSGTAVVSAGLLAGLGLWLGAWLQGIDLGLGTLLGAGLNVVPTALVALGLGAVTFSVAARASAVGVYTLVIWSMFTNLLTPLIPALTWMDRLSLFHYMALVPGQDADAGTVIATAALGVLLCGVATALFANRDLRPV